MTRCKLIVVATLSGFLLLPISVIAPSIAAQEVAAQEEMTDLSYDEIHRIAQGITVRIYAGQGNGSGTLISKQGETYTVLTNDHVLLQGETYQVQTQDGQIHRAIRVRGVDWQGQDLAILQFNSERNYATASLEPSSDLVVSEPVFAAGFPYDSEALILTTGQVSQLPEQSLADGYHMGYTNNIQQGMSGGPILNAHGELVGINGMSAYPIANTAYVFEDGSHPSEAEIVEMRRSSWGIPIQIVARLAPQLIMESSNSDVYQAGDKQVDNSVESYYQQGIIQFKENDYEGAIASFNRAIELNFDSPEVYYWRGLAYGAQERLSEALEDFNHAIALNSQYAEAYAFRGLARYVSGEQTQGLEDIERASQLNPNAAEVFYASGMIHFLSDEYLQAIQSFSRAIELDANFALAFRWRSVAYLSNEDYHPAIEDANRALEFNPNDEWAYASRSLARANIGEYSAAIEDANQALESSSQNSFVSYFAYFGRGLAQLKLLDNYENFERAVEDFTQAIQLVPNEASAAYAYRGVSYLGLENYPAAIADFTRILEIEQSNESYTAVHTLRGLAYALIADYQNALEDANRALELAPQNAEAQFIIGLTYLASGRIDEGLDILRAVRASIEENSSSYPSANLLVEYFELSSSTQEIAEDITVRIDKYREGDSHAIGNGSGVLVARQGNTYYVLTARHVVDEDDVGYPAKYKVVTADGTVHEASLAPSQSPRDIDLAVLQFTSNKIYRLATLASYPDDNPESVGRPVFVFGFPQRPSNPSQQLWRFSPGLLGSRDQGAILVQNSVSLTRGYELVYTSFTQNGMSGGPVLDLNGRVIGIHGRSESVAFVNDEAGDADYIPLGFSLGIPIRTFLELSNSFGLEEDWLTVEDSTPTVVETNTLRVGIALQATRDIPYEPSQVSGLLTRGNLLWRSTQLNAAAAAFEEAINIQPNSSEAWFGLSLTRAFQEQYQEAFDAIDRAVSLNPNEERLWYWHGALLTSLGRSEEAIVSLNQAIKIQEDSEEQVTDPTLYLMRADALRTLGRYEEAIEDLNRAIAINPFAIAYAYRGFSYLMLENYPQALADSNQALQLNPNYPDAYALRGLLQVNAENYSDAISDSNRAIEIDSNQSLAYATRSVARSLTGDYSGAIEDANHAFNLKPIDIVARLAHLGRGIAYRLTDNPSQAVDDLTRIIESVSNSYFAYLNRGLSYITLENYTDAATDLTKAIELSPNSADAYIGRSLANLGLENATEALSDANRAIELNSESASAYAIRSIARAHTEDYLGAVEDANRALELEPDNPNLSQLAYLGRGFAYQGSKKYPEALEDLNQVIELNSNFAPQAYTNIGLILYEMGDLEEALQNWQIAIRIDSYLAETQLAIAVVLYSQGEQEQALSLGEAALRADKRLADLEYLRKNLWGDQMLRQAEGFLNLSRIHERLFRLEYA
jgi:tetratricopeptide (TPR) repeat protein